jgi:hypothetical protein
LNIEKNINDDYPFERTAMEETEARKRWARRLLGLNEAEQQKISKKYYGGTMPWKENAK